MNEKCQKRVAIVGSGLAGLTTGYLLHQDPNQRFAVTLFEEVRLSSPQNTYSKSITDRFQSKGDKLALDSASISVKHPETGGHERIDLPMRAFAGGYYETLMNLYDHLNIKYEVQPFLYSFSKAEHQSSNCGGNQNAPYFIHSSNNHRIPPVRPQNMPLYLYILESAYLIIMYSYFTICCSLLRPHVARYV